MTIKDKRAIYMLVVFLLVTGYSLYINNKLKHRVDACENQHVERLKHQE